MHRFRIGFIILLAVITGYALHPASAQEDLGNVTVDYAFGDKITFQLVLPDEVQAASVRFFLQPEGESNTRSIEAFQEGPGEYIAVLDLKADPIRTFSNLVYEYEVIAENGETYSSDPAEMYYEDNRFDWKAREEISFRVHYYEGDTGFAQSILDVANQGLEKIQTLLPLSTPSEIDIYVYANALDMRDSLQLATRNWVGAHADPDLGVMVVSLPIGPEQRLEMERQIPHELLHIMLYQQIGEHYINLPMWLIEGLASISELYPNPDYLVLLSGAQKRESLLSIASLCNTFPRDASGAYLAYAEAASFTRYLYRQFGTTGLDALVATYGSGVSCERGVEIALNASLNQLERQWRRDTFGENPWSTAAPNLAPWLVILGLALGVPITISIYNARRKPVEKRTSNRKI